MSQVYSDPSRESDPHALPDVEVFQLTAEEACEFVDEDIRYEYAKRFPLASFNSRERQHMLDEMLSEQGITGGWFYRFCYPGCLPDSDAFGPFATRDEAIAAAQSDCA